MAIATGRRIAMLRLRSGISQTKLAEVLGVDQTTISKWESAERMPDPYVMSEFAAKFRVTLDFLYRGRLDAVPRYLAIEIAKRHPELVVLRPSDMDADTDSGPG